MIEMLTVVAIMMLMTVAVMVSSNQFNGSVLLRSLASQVGLSLREAQLYGVSVKGTGAQNATSHAYGVEFAAANTGSYTLFSDTDDSIGTLPGSYTAGDTTVETLTLPNGFKLSGVCVLLKLLNGSSVYSCAGVCPSASPTGTTCTAPLSVANTKLAVAFKRPDPNADFSGSGLPVGSIAGAMLVVTSPSGLTRAVTVSTLGLIAVQGN